MNTPQICPKCNSEDAYFDGSLWVCPSCFHEWTMQDPQTEDSIPTTTIRDAHGNILQDGDAVTVIKDLKVKGASSALKVGTKVKNIKLNPNGTDGHNINCKIDGFGSMSIKSEFVKKS